MMIYISSFKDNITYPLLDCYKDVIFVYDNVSAFLVFEV